ncbi:hypothetical protein B9Z19DRAFT_1136837 [Tuber borchii]|uniref:Uncharacterized protein n=1 Tax=Tuber borchii TaxID=42251 RepID=A0A2T6ZB66_TUBBO|nr:hypothetical protein B9Z19DRAFT_1136837 [Tuber borchii]
MASNSDMNEVELHNSLHIVSDKPELEINSQLSRSAAFQECSDLIHVVAEVKPYTATHGNITKVWKQVLERLQQLGWFKGKKTSYIRARLDSLLKLKDLNPEDCTGEGPERKFGLNSHGLIRLAGIMEKVVWEINEFESNKNNQTEAWRNALIQEESRGMIIRQIAMEGMQDESGRVVAQNLQSSEIEEENAGGEDPLENEEPYQATHSIPGQGENGQIFIDPQWKRKYQRKQNLEEERRPRGRPRKLQRTASGSI